MEGTMNPNLQASLDRLNPTQKEATMNTVGPELIIAGAGSGKTSVLTTRIALLLEQGILPDRILALTFTKKAADEMKQRVIDIHGDAARRVWMGTFHSIFIRFLRPNAAFLNFPENFTILDEEDSMSTLKRTIDQIIGAGRVPEEQRTEEMIKEYKAQDAHYKPKTIHNIISTCKNDLITADHYFNDPEFYQRDMRAQRPLTGQIFRAYRDQCHRMAMMDFDDILLYTDMLLANRPDVCMAIASSFDYILVDEYQDTNRAQYSILRRLTQRNNNICVVGDDSQSIYAFRGARIENILNFKKDFPNCRMYKLERNYRSTKTIVDAANLLIRNNTQRIDKVCFSEAEKGSPIRLQECNDERHEANFIASVIQSKVTKEGYRYSDFAVLYRTNSQSRAIEDSLIKKSVPYVIYSGLSFFERMEVKDLMAYYKLSVNPNDDESFRRVVNKPVRGVGAAALEKLTDIALANNMSLWKVIHMPNTETFGLSKKAYKGIMDFRNIIHECIEWSRTKGAHAAAVHISDLAGFYQEYINDGSEEAKGRADNIRELVDSVKYFEEDIENLNQDLDDLPLTPDMAGFLQNVLLLSNADTDPENANKVSLMTVHCAKGLEFKTVFVAGMETELFPLEIDGTPTELEEERRLFYVAMTRAQKELFLTKADSRMRFGKHSQQKLSTFVYELGLAEPKDEDEQEEPAKPVKKKFYPYKQWKKK